MIDRIEFHVSSALEYVEEAVKDTKKAMEYQRKARRVCLIVIYFSLQYICAVLHCSATGQVFLWDQKP